MLLDTLASWVELLAVLLARHSLAHAALSSPKSPMHATSPPGAEAALAVRNINDSMEFSSHVQPRDKGCIIIENSLSAACSILVATEIRDTFGHTSVKSGHGWLCQEVLQ